MKLRYWPNGNWQVWLQLPGIHQNLELACSPPKGAHKLHSEFLGPWDRCLEVELLSHMIAQFLVFWKVYLLFPKKIGAVDIPTSSRCGFLFPKIHANTSSLGIFEVCRSQWYEIIFQCCFDLNFLRNKCTEHFFHMLIFSYFPGHFMSSLRKFLLIFSLQVLIR